MVAVGRGPRWYRPIETLTSLSRLQMDVQGVVLFDNLAEKEKQLLTKQVKDYGPIPVWDTKEGQAAIDRADICLTTNEMFNTKTKQLFIPMVPLTGTEGEVAFLRAIYRLLCRYGNKGGIAYVTV